jgi:hypothetical protein
MDSLTINKIILINSLSINMVSLISRYLHPLIRWDSLIKVLPQTQAWVINLLLNRYTPRCLIRVFSHIKDRGITQILDQIRVLINTQTLDQTKDLINIQTKVTNNLVKIIQHIQTKDFNNPTHAQLSR